MWFCLIRRAGRRSACQGCWRRFPPRRSGAGVLNSCTSTVPNSTFAAPPTAKFMWGGWTYPETQPVATMRSTGFFRRPSSPSRAERSAGPTRCGAPRRWPCRRSMRSFAMAGAAMPCGSMPRRHRHWVHASACAASSGSRCCRRIQETGTIGLVRCSPSSSALTFPVSRNMPLWKPWEWMSVPVMAACVPGSMSNAARR